MRILHVDTGREMRGGQWQALFLHRELVHRGYDSLLLCPADAPLHLHARTARLPVAAPGIAPWPESDITHAHDARAHTAAAFRRRAGLVVSRRVAFAPQRTVISRWKYRQPARFIAISEYVKCVLIEAGVDPACIRVVYDGVTVPASYRPGQGHTIVAPASADSMKGDDLVRELSRQAGLPVQFSADLPRDLLDAALFLYFSRSEGLGSAALLAAAYGVPVVGSRIGGLTEAVEDGVTGVLVDNDPAAAASAVKELMADPERRRSMGEAGRKRVLERFTIKSMVDGTCRVYEELPTL